METPVDQSPEQQSSTVSHVEEQMAAMKETAEAEVRQADGIDTVVDDDIVMEVKGGIYDGQRLSFDLFSTQLVIDKVLKRWKGRLEMSAEEAMSGFPETFNPSQTYYRRDPMFLRELSADLADVFGKCTPAIADWLWHKVGQVEDVVKKNTGDQQS